MNLCAVLRIHWGIVFFHVFVLHTTLILMLPRCGMLRGWLIVVGRDWHVYIHVHIHVHVPLIVIRVNNTCFKRAVVIIVVVAATIEVFTQPRHAISREDAKDLPLMIVEFLRRLAAK